MSEHRRDNRDQNGQVEIKRERSRSPLKQPELTDAKRKLKNVGIQMKLAAPQKPEGQPKPKMTVASAFNQDSDEEPEEMPAHARMRMRNVGRNTPTSSGPNSFGKTKQGFSDSNKIFERSLREKTDPK